MTATADQARSFGGLSSLLSGVGLLGLGNGLLNTLIGVRASIEGFDTLVTGLIVAGYYVGFIGGSQFAVKAVGRVGHIRIFAALASTASTATLVYGLVVSPVAWLVVRLISGFCMAGLYVAIESWLNSRADNTNRGRVLSGYLAITMLAVAASQLLLTVAPIEGLELFVLSSILVSMSLVPVVLTGAKAPPIIAPEPLSLVELWQTIPTGIVVIFITGVSVGALRGIGAVYAAEIDMSPAAIGAFVASISLGASLLQTPVGRLSDTIPRRVVMLTAVTGAAALSAVGALVDLETTALIILMFGIGGLAVPMYSLGIAYTNDWLTDDQRVPAAALLILVNGAGSIVGPVLAGAVMSFASANGFFATLVATHTLTATYLVYRIMRRRAHRVSEQTRFLAMSSRGVALAVLRQLTPRKADGQDHNGDETPRPSR
ncbi:MAG: MFS transporter [Actinomycetia bacterium]|nr:MFS transporter [Actinomycetes bacterium]MCP4958570.1 MFS transporter [Actinomycetes bacterium]